MAQTLAEQIVEIESEITAYTTMLINQSGFRKLTGAGNEGASTEFTDPVKIKELRTEARDRLAMLKLKQTQGYVE
jgi:hypothetical protein